MIEKRDNIVVWPEEWRDELLEKVTKAYDAIGRENFVEHFKFFNKREAKFGGLHINSLLESHPIEYGFYLLLDPGHHQHRFLLPPGYFSWAYSFSLLCLKLQWSSDEELKKDIRDGITSGLTVKFETEPLNITPVFSHMRAYDFTNRSSKGFKVASGKSFGIDADLGLECDGTVTGMDVKCFLQGWSKSNFDGLLESQLQEGGSIETFGNTTGAYALLTLPNLKSFFGKTGTLKRSSAIEKFNSDLAIALKGQDNPNSCFESVVLKDCELLSGPEITAITSKYLPKGHSKKIYKLRRPIDITAEDWKGRFICFYMKDSYNTYEENILKQARRAVKQAGVGNGAMMAIDLNFTSGFKCRSAGEFHKYLDSIETVKRRFVETILGDTIACKIQLLWFIYDLPFSAPPMLGCTQPITNFQLFRLGDSKLGDKIKDRFASTPLYDW